MVEKSGTDLLTLRPRTTELLDVGLLTMEGKRATVNGHSAEGVYRVSTEAEWEGWRNMNRANHKIQTQQVLI